MIGEDFTQDIAYVQKGLPFFTDVTVVPSDTSAKLSNSSFEVFKKYREKTPPKDTVVSMDTLGSIYTGDLGHQYLFFLTIMDALEVLARQDRFPTPLSYIPFCDPNVYSVLENAFMKCRDLFEQKNAENMSTAALAYWATQQDFYTNIPPKRYLSFHEAVLFQPGAREKVWEQTLHSNRIQQLRNTMLRLRQEAHRTGSTSTNFVVETPCNVHLKKGKNGILVWTQPDKVMVQDGTVYVVDYKFEEDIKPKADFDAYDWIQVAMLGLAGASLAHKFLHFNQNPSKKKKKKSSTARVSSPPYSLVELGHIETLLQHVVVDYRYPEVVERGRMKHQSFSFGKEGHVIAAVLYNLGYIIDYLANPYQRNDFYDYRDMQRAAREGVSPKVMPMQPQFNIQPMLDQLVLRSRRRA